MSYSRRFALGLLAAPFLVRTARSEPVFVDGQGIALRGYDPVSFLGQLKAQKGSFDHELTHDGTIWRFANAENLKKFEADPDTHIPAFGGYDAWGIARGYKRGTDPELWVEGGGRIFLFYSVGHQNLWAGDIAGNIALGDKNWPGLKDF